MSQHPPAKLLQREFGHLCDGRAVHEITLSHGGLALSFITLGGIVTTLRAPDRAGVAANVVRGFDSLADYEQRNPFFGVIVGRYANRIALGDLVIDGETFALSRNNGTNCLHGGTHGWGTRLWEIESLREHDDALGGPAATLRYVSADGEEGFPGRVEARVTYALGADRSNVVRLILRGAFLQAGIGLAIGLLIVFLVGRYVADQLYAVHTWDPVSIAIAVGVLSLAAALAGFISARRAASIEPMRALRIESCTSPSVGMGAGDGKFGSRLSLWVADNPQEPGFCDRSGTGARAWHRGEHSHL